MGWLRPDLEWPEALLARHNAVGEAAGSFRPEGDVASALNKSVPFSNYGSRFHKVVSYRAVGIDAAR